MAATDFVAESQVAALTTQLVTEIAFTRASTIQRANHTGTQPSTSISDFTEAVQDAVAAVLTQGTNITLTYDDALDTLTVTSAGGGDPEAIRDAIGIALVGLAPIGVSVDDLADTITITTTATQNSTDAALRDRATHTGVQTIATITGLQAALDLKAPLANPTFSGTVVVPVPTAATHAARKDYVDTALAGYVPKKSATIIATATHTIVADNDERMLVFTAASVVSVTIPTGLTVGHRGIIMSAGAGGVELVTTGLTLVGSAPVTTVAQNGTIYYEVTAANTIVIQSSDGATGGAGAGGGPGGIRPAQSFSPDAAQVTSGTANFAVAYAESVVFVTLNGLALRPTEYSLTGTTLTVTPLDGFYSTETVVLVYQGTFVSDFVPKSVATTNTLATYTVLATDDETTKIHNNASAVVITYPTGLPVGHKALHVAAGAGGISLVTTGLTLIGSTPKVACIQNEGLYVEVTATNTLVVLGGTV